MDSKSQLCSFCILYSTNGTCDANSEVWVIRIRGNLLLTKWWTTVRSHYLVIWLFSLFRLDWLLICYDSTFLRLSAGKWNRCHHIKFLQHATKLCSLSLSGRQGQVKGSYCQCLLMGPAQGSDGRVISVMMMVMVSYRLPRVPQVHTYLWHATCLSQPEHICLTTGPFGCLPKQNRSITTILLASH